jgi:hypothetical protein
MRRALLIAAVAVVSSVLTAAAIVLPASAGGRGDGTSRERIQEFESCMREHGFELGPETEVVISPDGVRVNGKEVDAESFRAARRECGPLFGGALPRLDGAVPPELEERFEGLRDCIEGREA